MGEEKINNPNPDPKKEENQEEDNDGSYDQELVTESLGKVGKGASILFVGTILGIFFNFLTRVVITRFYTPSDYGMFNLYWTILSIFAAIGSIGLRNGIQRNISYYLGKDDKEKVPAIIGWGLAIGLAGGIIFAIGLFFFSDFIASFFSDDPILGYYFKIAALAVPSWVITTAMVSVFRGFERTKERILFQTFGRYTLMLAFAIVVSLLSLPFQNVILSVSIGIISLSIIFFIYYLKNKKDVLGIKKAFKWDISLGKKLLIFSLPLLLVDIMYRVMGWADTMMIGYFLTEDSVGFYNVAKPLSKFISTGLSISLFIYSPIAASLYAKEKIQENKIIYTVITKWICFSTLPIALVFVFYPRWVISFLFGQDYMAAVIPLQILAVTFFINNFMGPNGATLTAYGKTKFLMYATSSAGILNIVLNGLLIPFYGIIGAAVATSISFVSVNMIRVKKLKDISSIHSIKFEIIKPIVLTISLTGVFVYLLRFFFHLQIVLVAFSGIIFYLIFFVSLLVTKSFSKDDIKILLLVEKRSGIDLTKIKKLLKKFV